MAQGHPLLDWRSSEAFRRLLSSGCPTKSICSNLSRVVSLDKSAFSKTCRQILRLIDDQGNVVALL
jgi:hypothetical protein